MNIIMGGEQLSIGVNVDDEKKQGDEVSVRVPVTQKRGNEVSALSGQVFRF